MSAETIVATKTNGTSDLTFSLVSRNGYTTRYADSANTAASQRFLDIDHVIKPSGAAGTDVHTLTLRQEVIDNDTQKLFVSKVSLQITVPRTDAITSGNIGDNASLVMCLMNTAFFEPFVQGVTTPGDYNVTGPFNPVRV